MTYRARILAVLRSQTYDRLPIVHFGFWQETLAKWVEEGRLTPEEKANWSDSNPDDAVSKKLGFDGGWANNFYPTTGLFPAFETRTIEEFPDGSRHVMNAEGVVVLQAPDATGIPSEIRHTLVDRKS